jgi:hypothetical protein
MEVSIKYSPLQDKIKKEKSFKDSQVKTEWVGVLGFRRKITYLVCDSGEVESVRMDFRAGTVEELKCSEKPFYALTQKDVQEKAQESKK